MEGGAAVKPRSSSIQEGRCAAGRKRSGGMPRKNAGGEGIVWARSLARSLARKARCGRHGRRQRHRVEVKRVNPARAVRVKCLNCRVTVRKTARRLCEFGIKEARERRGRRSKSPPPPRYPANSISSVRVFRVAGERRVGEMDDWRRGAHV